ncbi:MAG: carbon monoxide dehydrogenase, partial [Chitinivibrionales bacterium]|nr:carbon monoxide dehydrogenase [Chitinivibrionales bacterium]
LAVDADPDANLASALGMPFEMQQALVPISQQRKLIEERTGAKVRQFGQMFKINPVVGDIAEKYAIHYKDVALLVLGASNTGGGGCACPENVMLKALVNDLVLYKNEALVMDMEAGVEHLGRATAQGVDLLIIVVEPGRRSIDSAQRIVRMSREIGLKKLAFVANKIDGDSEDSFVRKALQGYEIVGTIPFCRELRTADREERSVLDALTMDQAGVFEGILDKLTIKVTKQ